ncbi:MAG TPA: hypothetical protein VNJ01_15960 [Bacteriovoracaceae bacterium]|nr:hypothetical protein [Bacteriovoracaceae bacterium]
MDKNFNDQELSDIMKEIEALEDDSILDELAQLDESESIPMSSPSVMSFGNKSNATASTAMSFKVQGNLNLELQFDIGGQVVCLEVTESGLSIQMEGGMTFSLPMGDKVHSKKAA